MSFKVLHRGYQHIRLSSSFSLTLDIQDYLRSLARDENYKRYTMIDVKVKDSDIRKAVEEGMDSFVQVFVDAIGNAIDNKLTLETMQQLNADQITLLAWSYLHQEVMDGGYVQLIYNGYGAFIFKNPFAVAMRNWGIRELYTHIRHGKKYYEKYHEAIEAVESDEDSWLYMNRCLNLTSLMMSLWSMKNAGVQ